MLRRYRSSPSLVVHLSLLYGMFQMPAGWDGNTLGPYIFGTEQPAHRELDVANALGVEPEPGTARQQPVVRVPLEQLRRDARGLPVGG